MNFDPKLKQAREEIKTILKKYDAQASMLLVSPTHVEYLFHLDTTWSVMRFEPSPDEDQHILRFRSKKEDFKSKEEQAFCTGSTVHGITSMLQFGEMVQKNMVQLLEALRTKMQIVYGVWGDKPDDIS